MMVFFLFSVLLPWLAVVTTALLVVIVCTFALCRTWARQSRSKLPHLLTPCSDGRQPITVGLFHPYCNAGGGGERVLWVAVRALQAKYSHVRCVIYTGDTDATHEEILRKAHDRFNIVLSQPIDFVFLERRSWVEAERYPHFTLLGQSLGSLVLGWEAMMKFVPDIYIDTMGYAFTLPLFRYLAGCQVACYVHYPTISTDMIQRVSDRSAAYNNEQLISRNAALSQVKLLYYRMFAELYGYIGRCSNVVLVNSSWTQGHIASLWAGHPHIVYPPCDTEQFKALPLHDEQAQHTIASIAQFRPEKDHPLQIKAFHKFISELSEENAADYSLVLVGSCRDDGDAQRVQKLEQLCEELGIKDRVMFKLNVSFQELKEILSQATIGLHTMWNEHFGIGVVEIMAAGTIILAHNSGGPKMDIVVDFDGQKTGFLAHDVDSYAQAMKDIFSLTSEQRKDIRRVARQSVDRFSEEKFNQHFLDATEVLFQSL